MSVVAAITWFSAAIARPVIARPVIARPATARCGHGAVT
jgi:hypothetical protein